MLGQLAPLELGEADAPLKEPDRRRTTEAYWRCPGDHLRCQDQTGTTYRLENAPAAREEIARGLSRTRPREAVVEKCGGQGATVVIEDVERTHDAVGTSRPGASPS